MTAPDDLIRRGDVLKIVFPDACSEALKGALCLHPSCDAVRFSPTLDALRALPADPVAEAAVAIVEHLFKFGVTSGDKEANRLCAAYRAAVAARAKETVPPALKPGDLAHEPSCIHAKNGSTGMIDARGRCAFCVPTKKENTR